MRKSLFVAVLGLCFTAGSTKALADTFIVDQANLFDDCSRGCFGYNVQDFAPIGQSFTPTLASLHDVEVAVEPAAIPGLPPSNLILEIRAGSITGTVLGTATNPVYSSTGYEDSYFALFDFNPTITLVPGDSYVFDLEAPAATAFLMLPDANNPYPGGTAFLSGAPRGGGGDFYFSEGPQVPEPFSMALLATAAGATFWLRRARRHGSRRR